MALKRRATIVNVLCAVPLLVRTQAYVETLDMLEFTTVFYALFLDPWKRLTDVESVFLRNNTKVP